MDVDRDNDPTFEVGRRHTSSSSRESSPVAKRQRRSFTPTSDDGDLVVPIVHNEDAETPTHQNPPLIRQAVGFSWTPSIDANISTYQASVAPQPAVPYFLPGQAPPPPPKPKSTKPRAPRKKKGIQYSDQTGKFKITGSNLSSSPDSGSTSLVPTSAGNSVDASSSSRATRTSALPRSMIPISSYVVGCANENTTAGPSNANGAMTGVAPVPSTLDTKRTRKSSKRKASASVSDSHTGTRPHPGQPPPISSSVTSQYPINDDSGEPSVERPGRAPDPQRTHSVPPGVASGGTPVGRSTASTGVTQGPAQNILRPMRMLTLLIEDLRSGVTDSQLAEVRVPLRVADDPEDGFWADAAEVCNTLQGGPSRIDGPAKVYSMRGKFRQFFMRVDQFDQLQVQPAHLAVTKERTLSIFVEAPTPQGQLPRPPAPHLDVRPVHNSGSEREAISSPTTTYYRPTYSLVTREDQMERLSKSNYARPERGRRSPVSESGSYGHSQRTTSPNAQYRSSRHDQYASSNQRFLTPPIPGQLADTQEEKDEAIANYIRSHIENHPGWIEYMQSKAKLQRVTEILKQYTFVEDRVRELVGRKTPPHWDGAPNSYVEKQHVWRVLKLDHKWGEECQETLSLVKFYGKNGSRYEDSRVVDMIDDRLPPRSNTMDTFLRLLWGVDASFTRDTFSGRFAPTPTQS